MIYYLPLEYIDQRYSSHLDRDICEYLERKKIDYVKIIEQGEEVKIIKGSFLDAASTISNKAYQISQIAKLYQDNTIKDRDIIFTTDLWFPGIESIAYLNYFCNKKVKVQGVIHAGSWTDTDFVRDMERWGKNFEEVVFDLADKIFVTSNFLKNDILKKRIVEKEKLVISQLPLNFKEMDEVVDQGKENIVIFNGRNVDEKQPWLFNNLRNCFSDDIKFINTQSENLSKKEYYSLLKKSKVVVSFALQENWGIGIQEAIYMGCIPVMPNRLVYKEQFDKKYLYNSFEECIQIVDKALKNELSTPEVVIKNNDEVFNIWFKD